MVLGHPRRALVLWWPTSGNDDHNNHHHHDDDFDHHPGDVVEGGEETKGGPKPSTDQTGFGKAATTSAVISAKAPTPVSSSQLAFTGVGTGLWTLVLVGSGLVVLGGALLVRRPRLRR